MPWAPRVTALTVPWDRGAVCQGQGVGYSHSLGLLLTEVVPLWRRAGAPHILLAGQHQLMVHPHAAASLLIFLNHNVLLFERFPKETVS